MLAPMNKGRRARKHTNSSGSFRWILALAALVFVVYFASRGFDAQDTSSSAGAVTLTSQNAEMGDFEITAKEDVKEVAHESSKETADFESTENDTNSADGELCCGCYPILKGLDVVLCEKGKGRTDSCIGVFV